MAEAAAMMTSTKLESIVVTGEAYPQHGNRTLAEVTYENESGWGCPSGATPIRHWPRRSNGS